MAGKTVTTTTGSAFLQSLLEILGRGCYSPMVAQISNENRFQQKISESLRKVSTVDGGSRDLRVVQCNRSFRALSEHKMGSIDLLASSLYFIEVGGE